MADYDIESERERFKKAFCALTGNEPLSWQQRLFLNHFRKNDLASCSVIDLPTGLGKTMVIAIWLIARSMNCKLTCHLPRRLVYVVDRRTVVDQATDIVEDFAFLLAPDNTKRAQEMAQRRPKVAERKKEFADTLRELRQGLDIANAQLAVSTLRGQLADNREWTKDPSRPAIIIGTVDLIGSGLLFSGYRSSYKRRPLEAGSLGQDSLLILDEAHLSRPFEKLIREIGSDGGFQQSQGSPMRVIRMSATSRTTDDNKVFRLDTDEKSRTFDLGSKIEGGKETNPIKKRFEASKHLAVKPSANVIETIAKEAGIIATDKPGSRIVIFVQSPKDVEKVRKELIKTDKSRESKIAQLTGTMRGLERDELVDLEAPLEARQDERRVMRRFLNPENDPSQGECFLISTSAGEVGFDLNADHLVGDETSLDSWIQRLGRVNRRGNGDATVVLVKNEKPPEKTDFHKACIETTKLLKDGIELSPKAIAALMRTLTPEQIETASSPNPATVEVTEILLDAWSMTSITQPMPGRPEVAPWLRGIADWEPPQTTIAWRAELDIEGFADLDVDDVEEWFEAHRILTHETLSVKTSDAADWFQDRWAKLPEARQRQLAKLPAVIDRAGMEVVPLGEVIKRSMRKNSNADDFLRNAEIIVPASFGGIRRGVGMFDPTEPKLRKEDENKPPEEQHEILKALQFAVDVADVRGRYRERVEKTEDGEATSTAIDPKSVKPGKFARYALELETDDDRAVRLVSFVRRFEKPETGMEPQTLKQHVCAVRKAMDRILAALSLPNETKLAAQLAADFHDHGKKRDRWQRLLILPKEFAKPDEPMGKSGGAMKRDPRGYRHEFGSLRELIDSMKGKVTDEIFDLAMHLIATHHGRGRPHFPKGGFDPDRESRSDEIHTEAIRRFARLQRKYGWWQLAWLENLLRCADALASADQDAGGSA